MKHAAFVTLLLAAAALTACAGQPVAGDIRLTRHTQSADDWSRFLPALYPGLTACLAADPAQPAYALSVVPQNHGTMIAYIVGADGSRRACSVDNAAARTPALMPATPLEDQALHGPRYTPAALPEPFLVCSTNEPVFTARGRLLGWLTYTRAPCRDAALPRLHWRAFGNEPFWSVTVAPDGILFDRVGELPLHYPARAGRAAGDRQTWILDRSGGGTNDKLELVITRTPCEDSMAQRHYDYRSEAIFRGQAYIGCAVQETE